MGVVKNSHRHWGVDQGYSQSCLLFHSQRMVGVNIQALGQAKEKGKDKGYTALHHRREIQ